MGSCREEYACRRFTSPSEHFSVILRIPDWWIPACVSATSKGSLWRNEGRGAGGEGWKEGTKKEVTEETKVLIPSHGTKSPSKGKRLGKREDRRDTQYSISQPDQPSQDPFKRFFLVSSIKEREDGRMVISRKSSQRHYCGTLVSFVKWKNYSGEQLSRISNGYHLVVNVELKC